MKKLKQWINARRDRRLRMWCVEQADTRAIGLSLVSSAQEIYDWVISTRQPSKPGVSGNAIIRAILSGSGCNPTCEHYPNLPES